MKKANEIRTKELNVWAGARGQACDRVVRAIWVGEEYEADTRAWYDCWFCPDCFPRISRDLTDAEDDYLERVLGDAYWDLPAGAVVLETREGTGDVDADADDWGDDDDDADEE